MLLTWLLWHCFNLICDKLTRLANGTLGQSDCSPMKWVKCRVVYKLPAWTSLWTSLSASAHFLWLSFVPKLKWVSIFLQVFLEAKALLICLLLTHGHESLPCTGACLALARQVWPQVLRGHAKRNKGAGQQCWAEMSSWGCRPKYRCRTEDRGMQKKGREHEERKNGGKNREREAEKGLWETQLHNVGK